MVRHTASRNVLTKGNALSRIVVAAQEIEVVDRGVVGHTTNPLLIRGRTDDSGHGVAMAVDRLERLVGARQHVVVLRRVDVGLEVWMRGVNALIDNRDLNPVSGVSVFPCLLHFDVCTAALAQMPLALEQSIQHAGRRRRPAGSLKSPTIEVGHLDFLVVDDGQSIDAAGVGSIA